MSNPLQVPGSLPWSSWNPPVAITATTELAPPPSQLGTVLKNVLAFTAIGGALGALAGVVVLGGGLSAALIPAALGANIGALFGVLEGMFLSGRDERRFATAAAEQDALVAQRPAPVAKRKGSPKVVVRQPQDTAARPSSRTRESWKS